MTIKVKEIIENRPVTFKTGEVVTKSHVLTEDGIDVWLWGAPSVGEELEGEITETQFGKEFRRARKSARFGKIGRIAADPDTMLIAYAKDIVVAFIGEGVIKTPTEAAKQWQNFSKLALGLYDKRKTEKTETINHTPNTDNKSEESPF